MILMMDDDDGDNDDDNDNDDDDDSNDDNKMLYMAHFLIITQCTSTGTLIQSNTTAIQYNIVYI